MDKQTYLTILLASQVTLIAMDLRQAYVSRHQRFDSAPPRPRAILFLLATILIYGCLQYGGLALVPNIESLLAVTQRFVRALVAIDSNDLPLSGLAIVLLGVAGFYFAGLCDYLFHRFASHSRPLWFAHENHHLPTDVSAYMPGLCVRPFAVVSIFPTTLISIFAVQLVLGVSGHAAWNPIPMIYVVVLVQATILGASHSSYLRRFWWVHKILKPLGITTPQEHWLHHMPNSECNYGNIVTAWDRVFGTYVDPQAATSQAPRAGLSYDQDFLGTITFGRLKLPERIRSAFQLDKFCHLAAAGQGNNED